MRYEKNSGAVLDFKIDWMAETNSHSDEGDWLEQGELLVSAIFTVDAPLVIDSSSITDGGTSATVWLSGGVVGKRYKVTCTVITSVNNRTDSRFFILYCVSK